MLLTAYVKKSVLTMICLLIILATATTCLDVYSKIATKIATSPAVLTTLLAFTFVICITTAFLAGRWAYEPVLAVDDQGFQDNSPFGVGNIRWEEISRVEVRSSRFGQRMLITLKDPDSSIKRRRGWERILMTSCVSKHPGPHIGVSLTPLSVSPEDIVQATQSYLLQGKQAARIPEHPWYVQDSHEA